MEEKDYLQVKEYYALRDSPANRFLYKLRWWHYVLAVLFFIFILWLSYSDVISSKFTLDEKAQINNALTYFNTSSNQTRSIMKKVNSAGHFNPTPILALTLFFILIIVYLLAKKQEKLLDYHMAVRIVKFALESEVGEGKLFPNGTWFKIGPEAKEIETGTVGLTAMYPSKWAIKVKAYFPNGLIKTYLAYVDAKNGKFKGLVEIRKEELDNAFRDVKIIKPRELWLAEAAKSEGKSLPSRLENPYVLFTSS